MSDSDFDDFDVFEVASSSPDFRSELAAQLAKLVPEAVADGKIDVTKLQELLADDVADDSERFGLFWPGKKRALRAAQEPTTATLRPDFENSKDWDTTQNVFIEGDNLEVLKIMQKHYHGKIKMIYIDPPYNTGKDFVYPDNYKEGLDSYLEWTRQVNEEGKKLSTNSETEGRYHSNWLNMMYPRLKLARNLLCDQGSMLISIDDHEFDNLRRLCSEVFGEANLEVMIWNKEAEGASGTLKATRTFRRVHEYVLVCHKNSDFADWQKIREALEGRESEMQTANLAVNAGNERADHPNFFTITNPSGVEFTRQWKWGRVEVDRLISEDLIYWGSDGRKQPRLIIPTDDRRTTYLKSILNYGGTTAGRKDFEQDLQGVASFSYPKPVVLMKKLILSASSKDDLVFDFFAGSGTTARAVNEANLEDGGTRRFILAQLPEPIEDEDSDGSSEAPQTISALALKRIRNALERSIDLSQKATQLETKGSDLGFRVFKLADSNFSRWRSSSETDGAKFSEHLLGLMETANDDASQDDLLFEILLKQGYSLSETVNVSEVAGLELRSVADGVLLAYLNEHEKPSLEQLRAVVAELPARLVVLEDAFHGDDELKTNLAQLCKSSGVELWTA